ncbi:MAG: hypothetical protein M3N21_01320 [Actinomycetota bacterium]|nr:hypothetical protein [Actinomycetota bacterium]
MRKQYHLLPSAEGLHAWDVDRLIELAQDCPVEDVSLTRVREIDENYWFNTGFPPTVRALVDHVRLMEEADLSFPILLDPEGRVMDGMHRVAQALRMGRSSITARRLVTLPPPDYVGIEPDNLPGQ